MKKKNVSFLKNMVYEYRDGTIFKKVAKEFSVSLDNPLSESEVIKLAQLIEDTAENFFESGYNRGTSSNGDW